MDSRVEDSKIFELYTLAELAYQKHFEKTVNNNDLLYPEGWYEKKNYKLKIEILTESIKNNTLIENTLKYQESIEGVRNVFIKEPKNQ